MRTPGLVASGVDGVDGVAGGVAGGAVFFAMKKGSSSIFAGEPRYSGACAPFKQFTTEL